MNRRGFLQTLLSAGVVLQLPRAEDKPNVASKRVTNVKRHSQEFDHGYQIGICIELEIDGGLKKGGTRFRYAQRIPTEVWKSMTSDQQEEAWLWLHSTTLQLATERGQIAA